METNTNHQQLNAPAEKPRAVYPPLGAVTKPNVTTAELAYYIDREPQTIRGWASTGKGPIQCMRISGRLAWPVAALKTLLGVA
ncbi:hypothetical protein [Polaromonas sp.]|uniref:hypothetical protein n=1 Tax=Polaromonas sp. TaxID=1869339 RepID=UPI00352B00E5